MADIVIPCGRPHVLPMLLLTLLLCLFIVSINLRSVYRNFTCRAGLRARPRRMYHKDVGRPSSSTWRRDDDPRQNDRIWWR